jgi:hypothetical protein
MRKRTMATTQEIDWTDVEAAAKQVAGNWRAFPCFAWSRSYDLEDADRWCVWYTSSRDAGLLEQSNEKVFNERLRPFSEGDDPDVVFERHSHWAVGYLDGFSLRVFNGGKITPAFEEFRRVKESLEIYPVLDEADYSDREFASTLESYRSEMWPLRKELPEGWESEVYSWFSDHGLYQFTDNVDDQGGFAPRDKIIEALQALGFLPTVVVER